MCLARKKERENNNNKTHLCVDDPENKAKAKVKGDKEAERPPY